MGRGRPRGRRCISSPCYPSCRCLCRRRICPWLAVAVPGSMTWRAPGRDRRQAFPSPPRAEICRIIPGTFKIAGAGDTRGSGPFPEMPKTDRSAPRAMWRDGPISSRRSLAPRSWHRMGESCFGARRRISRLFGPSFLMGIPVRRADLGRRLGILTFAGPCGWLACDPGQNRGRGLDALAVLEQSEGAARIGDQFIRPMRSWATCSRP